MSTCQCFSCKGVYPDIDGPVHRYMSSSAGCWSIYGEILAREYSDATYFGVHRLTVDAYAAQHPGSTDRQSIQSVGLHLVRLCLFIEHGLKAEDANDAMLEAAKNKRSFFLLEPPQSLGSMTAADVHKAHSAKEHQALVIAWSESVWEAWSQHHSIINTWLPNRVRHQTAQ